MKYNKSWVSILFGNTAKGVIRLSRDNLLLGKNNKGKFLHRQAEVYPYFFNFIQGFSLVPYL